MSDISEPVVGEPRSFVVGTAGHIDHGKSSLVRALTGTDPDRLPEEKARGITIELGFAETTLIDGTSLSFVDVPGHEKFVRTMAAGASGVDAIVLVVAADDGMMPQTHEHLAVCEFLGVKRGLVALTKTDAVEPDMVELCREEILDAVGGTFLEGADIVATSALEGKGLDDIRAKLVKLFGGVEPRASDGPPILPVDRIFSIAGFGTVCTGTLLHGTLEEGASLRVLPELGRDVVVRGLQVHGKSVALATAGQRVAVNLRGADVEDLQRGALLTSHPAIVPTAAVHGIVRRMPSSTPLKENAELSVSLGTMDALARVVPLGPAPMGDTEYVRFVFGTPVPTWSGQRFVLRRPGAHGIATIGGGTVIDPHPVQRKGAFAQWVRTAAALAGEGDAVSKARFLIDEAGHVGLLQSSLVSRLALDADIVLDDEVVVSSSGAERRYFSGQVIEQMNPQIGRSVDEFHENHPLLLGPLQGEVVSAQPPHHRATAELCIKRLQETGALAQEDGRVFNPKRTRAKADADLQRTLAVLERARLKPPLFPDWAEASSLADDEFTDAVTELRRRQSVVQLAPNLCFAAARLAELKGEIQRHFASNEVLQTADLKKIGGDLSRKHAIPLLEWLDKEGITRRDGDVRRRGKAPGES